MSERRNLARMFSELGVDTPESWAESQIAEGLPQLARATILVEFADAVRSATDTTLSGTDLPHPRLDTTLARIREAGIADDDLAVLLKFTASQAVFNVCALLDGATEISNNPGSIVVALAHGVSEADDPDADLEVDDLSLHESWGEVATAILGEGVFWS